MKIFSKLKEIRNWSKNVLNYWPWVALALIVLFAAAVRARLLYVPLERDEGEFAYMGQLMIQGIPPYLMAYNMKLPGMYAAYALVMAFFGQTIAGIHIGLMLGNATAIVLLFFLARRLFNNTTAVVAAACYALLSLSPSVLGTVAHATQFMVPLILGGTLLLLRGVDSGSRRPLFWSGLLFGTAFLLKQHAIFFIAFALSYFVWMTIKKVPFDIKKLIAGSASLLIAAAVPFGITCILLYAAGVFKNFWFWTFTYGYQYVTENSLSNALVIFAESAPHVIKYWLWVWVMAGIGLTSVLWDKAARSRRAFIFGMMLFSFLSVCPGFYFRNHYFVTMLPVIALLAGIATNALIGLIPDRRAVRIAKAIPVFMIAAALIYPVIRYREFFFQAAPIRASQMMYGISPFPNSAEIAEYIKNHTTSGDRIVIFGSEPQICFYADRKSATGYIYMYALMEPQAFSGKMQSEVIREVESARPKYAIRINVLNSWVRRTDSDPMIFRWADEYFGNHYRMVGFVDISPDGRSRSFWDEAAKNNRPKFPFNLQVFERTTF
ncbi:MAG TPA: glycosyltransferase family 39 protein [Acidobacteriota bacterium]|nr:glycosyltransferase family 39 protein [Acidobacteriota bacterium]